MALIELKNIIKTYYAGEDSFNALDNISLSIEKGEFVGIMGASGSGKSTCMNVLGTLDKIYGKSGDPIVENIAIAAEHGFVKEFDDEIMAEIEDIPDYLTDEDKKGLVDLTHLPFCTIDPKTCT